MLEKIHQILQILENQNIVLLGTGGNGKTMLTLACVRELLSQRQRYHMVPIYVPVAECDGDTYALRRYFATHYLGDCAEYDGNEQALFAELEKTIFDNREHEQRYVFFLDGVNETYSSDKYNAEIMYLSLMKNVRIVYVSRSLQFPIDQCPEAWCLLSATGIPENVVENYVEDPAAGDELIELLTLPFFLSKYVELKATENAPKATDKYSFLGSYINEHLASRSQLWNSSLALEDPLITYKDVVDYVLEEWVPRLCAYLSYTHQGILFRADDEELKEYNEAKYLDIHLILNKVLVPMGLVTQFAKNLFKFTHETYFDYFVVRYFRREIPKRPHLLAGFPSEEAMRFLVSSFGTKKELLAYLKQVNKAIGAMEEYRSDPRINLGLVTLYSMATSCLEDEDFSNRDLSLCDFSRFSRITNTDFSGSKLSSLCFDFPGEGVEDTGYKRNLYPIKDNPGVFLCHCDSVVAVVGGRWVGARMKTSASAVSCITEYDGVQRFVLSKAKSTAAYVYEPLSLDGIAEFSLTTPKPGETIVKMEADGRFLLLCTTNDDYIAAYENEKKTTGDAKAVFDIYCVDLIRQCFIFKEERCGFAHVFSEAVWYKQGEHLYRAALTKQGDPVCIYSQERIDNALSAPHKTLCCDVVEALSDGYCVITDKTVLINGQKCSVPLDEHLSEVFVYSQSNDAHTKCMLLIKNKHFDYRLVMLDLESGEVALIPYRFTFPVRENFLFDGDHGYIIGERCIYHINEKKTIRFTLPVEDEINDTIINGTVAIFAGVKNLYYYDMENAALLCAIPMNKCGFGKLYSKDLSLHLITQCVGAEGETRRVRLKETKRNKLGIRQICRSQNLGMRSNLKDAPMLVSAIYRSHCDRVYLTDSHSDTMTVHKIGVPRDQTDNVIYNSLRPVGNVRKSKIPNQFRTFYLLEDGLRVDDETLLLEYRQKDKRVVRKIGLSSKDIPPYMAGGLFDQTGELPRACVELLSTKEEAFFLPENAPFFLAYTKLLRVAKAGDPLRTGETVSLSYDDYVKHGWSLPEGLEPGDVCYGRMGLKVYDFDLNLISTISLPLGVKPEKVLYANGLLFVACANKKLLLIREGVVRECDLLMAVDDWYYDERKKRLITAMDGSIHQFGQDVVLLFKATYSIDEKMLEVTRKRTRAYSLAGVSSCFLGLLTTEKKRPYFVFENGIYASKGFFNIKRVLKPFACQLTGSAFKKVSGLSKEALKTLKTYGAII